MDEKSILIGLTKSDLRFASLGLYSLTDEPEEARESYPKLWERIKTAEGVLENRAKLRSSEKAIADGEPGSYGRVDPTEQVQVRFPVSEIETIHQGFVLFEAEELRDPKMDAFQADRPINPPADMRRFRELLASAIRTASLQDEISEAERALVDGDLG